MLDYLVLFGCFFLLIKIMWSVISFKLSLSFLQSKPILENSSVGKEQKIFIIIPLLREQQNLDNLLLQFGKMLSFYPYLHLILVTTEREILEKKKGVQLSTKELIENSKVIKNIPEDRRSHFHFPHFNNTLAEQLNFALSQLNCHNLANEDDYILFYNADGIVDPRAIEYFKSCIINKVVVAQQSSLFLKNIDNLIRTKTYLVAGDAIYQSSWTLLHEIPRFLISSNFISFVPTFISRLWFAHCVSHGLLIKFSVLKKHGFPESKIGLEDSALGFLLRVKNIPILPIYSLENSNAAENLKSLIRQKSTWVRGPLGSLEYFNNLNEDKYKVKSLVLLLQGLYSGLKWSLGGVVLLCIFYAYFFSTYNLMFLLLYFTYCAITLISVLIVWNLLPETIFPRVSYSRLIPVFSMYILVPILHSFSGFIGLLKVFSQILLNKEFVQSKTEAT